MRCLYCHNPDSWAVKGGTEMSADELLDKAQRYKSYWGKEGGITVSGGEALMQIDFLTELFKKAKERGINTCLDTAAQPFRRQGTFFEKFAELMRYTDLILLDIKQIDSEKHKSLTGHDNKNILDCADYLSEIGKPVWIRHVLVPGITDNDEDLIRLSKFIGTLSNVQKIEILPYHNLGAFKWKNLGMQYTLEGTPSPSPESIAHAQSILIRKNYR